MSTAYLVGNPEAGWSKGLEERLRMAGVGILRVSSEALPESAGCDQSQVIVLCCPDDDCVGRALAWARRARAAVPVVILVDRADFGQYYCLMADGVWGYFSLDESVEAIARGIVRAARVAAG